MTLHSVQSASCNIIFQSVMKIDIALNLVPYLYIISFAVTFGNNSGFTFSSILQVSLWKYKSCYPEHWWKNQTL